MSDLPRIFDNNPLQLLAEKASPEMIHDWIDALYETDFIVDDPRLPFLLFTVTALCEYTETHPLNPDYQKKFNSICELAFTVCGEALEQMKAQTL